MTCPDCAQKYVNNHCVHNQLQMKSRWGSTSVSRQCISVQHIVLILALFRWEASFGIYNAHASEKKSSQLLLAKFGDIGNPPLMKLDMNIVTPSLSVACHHSDGIYKVSPASHTYSRGFSESAKVGYMSRYHFWDVASGSKFGGEPGGYKNHLYQKDIIQQGQKKNLI